MNNDIILLIGASSDLGLDLIKNIENDSLIIAHYNSCDKNILELAKSLNKKIITIKADLSNDVDVNNLLNEIESKYGTPNKIVNFAASKFSTLRFKDISWSDFEKDINISLKAFVNILNKFIPKLIKEKKEGNIVVVLSSVTLNVPPKNLVHYTTVKYALLGLVKSLASEYADKNININAVSPSMIETKFLSDINEKLVELSAYNNPKKRNANVNDVTPIIKLLLSKDSNYITGANIPISGGAIF